MDNDVQIQTLTPKSKGGIYKLLVVFELVVAGILLFLGYTFLFRVQKPIDTRTSDASQIAVQQTPIPTTKIEIPHTYKIKSITDTNITFAGDEGELAAPNGGPGVMVFRGTPQNAVESTTGELKVDQEVVLEIIPGEKIWIYILNP